MRSRIAVIEWGLTTLLLAAIVAHAGELKITPAPEELSTRELIEAIVERGERGEWTGDLATQAALRGMSGALECVAALKSDAPRQNEILLDLIARAGRSRRSNPELLKLYDPVAFDYFYTDKYTAQQQRIAAALEQDAWPRALPDAALRAAPGPTLSWLRKQAASAEPNHEHLRLIFQQWGVWIRFHNERQFSVDVYAAIGSFVKNGPMVAQPESRAALLHFIRDTSAIYARSFVLESLRNDSSSVRAEGCMALTALGEKAPPAELLTFAQKETDPTVLAKCASAMQAWPHDPAAGEAELKLFDRIDDPKVRREIMHSVADTCWPQRREIIQRGFQNPDHGVLGAALQALAKKSIPEMLPQLFELLEKYDTTPPLLVDALGALADSRAAPRLIHWLKNESNPALKLKLILALEKTGGDQAAAALAEMLRSETSPLLAEHLAGITGRARIESAIPTLIALATDATAPATVRLQSIWSLGCFDNASARDALRGMRANLERSSPDTQTGALQKSPEIDATRALVAMARLRMKDAVADDEVMRLYEHGTPAAQLSILMALTEMKRDHPAIAKGLESQDFALMRAAIAAAGAAAPEKYRAQLLDLEHAPFIQTLLESSLDTVELEHVFNKALQRPEDTH